MPSRRRRKRLANSHESEQNHEDTTLRPWPPMVNESGTFAVLRAGDTLDVLAVNKPGESVRATPALAGD